ncbi:hypothetical protein HDU93_005380, partial [Gonapodya sp. JEL0774]
SRNIADLAVTLQSDASAIIIGQLESYLKSAAVSAQSVADVVNLGAIDAHDIDRMIPFMRNAVQTVGLKRFQPIVANGVQVGTIQVWSTNNNTCAKYCPTNNTMGKLNGYVMIESGTSVSFTPPIFSFPFNITATAIQTPNLRTPTIDQEPGISPDGTDVVTQHVFMSLWDPAAPASAGNPEAAFFLQEFSVENLSNLLDELKNKSGTLNSFYGIVTGGGIVMAMTDLGNTTQQRQV